MKQLLLSVLLLGCLAASSQAQVPAHLCVSSARGSLSVDTQNLTFDASFNGQSFSGPFQVLFWQPDLFYVAGIGITQGLSFYANISFLRNSSFANVKMAGQSFTITNESHGDCDGNPSLAPPFTARIYPIGEEVEMYEDMPTIEGESPFSPMLCAIPSDSAVLTTYLWSTGEVGNMIHPTFTEGEHLITVEAIYNDIKTTAKIVAKVGEHKDPPVPVPSPPVNRPPSVTITQRDLHVSKKSVVVFDTVATDPDGDPVTVNWELPDGSTVTGSSASFKFILKGSFTVTAHARDGRGGDASDSVTVKVAKRL